MTVTQAANGTIRPGGTSARFIKLTSPASF